MMRPLTDDTLMPPPVKRCDLDRQPRNVVGHLDVENTDRLLVRPVDGDPRGADLLAEDRQRVIGQRADVGDVRIADRDVGEVLIGADVFGLADASPSLSRCGSGVGPGDALFRMGRHRRERQSHGRQSAALIQPRRNSAPICGAAGVGVTNLSFYVPMSRACAGDIILNYLYWLFTSASPPLVVVPKSRLQVSL